MKSTKLLLTLILLLTPLFALISCTTKVVEPDIEWCGDKGVLGAHCTYSVSTNKDRDIDKFDWDQLRFTEGWVCTKGSNFLVYKGAFEKACNECNCCTPQDAATLARIEEKILRVQRTKADLESQGVPYDSE